MSGKVLAYHGVRPVLGRAARTSWVRLSDTNAEIGKGIPIIATTAGADRMATAGTVTAGLLLGVAAQYKKSGSDRATELAANPESAKDPKYDANLMIWTPEQRFYIGFDTAMAATPEIVIPDDIGSVFVLTGVAAIDAITMKSQVLADLSTEAVADADALVRLVGIPDFPENELAEGKFVVGEFEFNMALTQLYGDTGGI